MVKMTKKELMEALTDYGYELNRPAQGYGPAEVLSNLVGENDVRLLEGFPVVYRNMLNRERPPHRQTHEEDLNKELSVREKEKFVRLLLLSYLLFRLYGEDKDNILKTERALNVLSDRWKESLLEVEKKFNHSDQVKLDDKVTLSTERLKRQFRNYVVNFGDKGSGGPPMSMELEVRLSDFFTHKQKMLLKKRLGGETLSKTEKEYFYRVVGKRLKSLSSDVIHDFAKSAVDRAGIHST